MDGRWVDPLNVRPWLHESTAVAFRSPLLPLPPTNTVLYVKPSTIFKEHRYVSQDHGCL